MSFISRLAVVFLAMNNALALGPAAVNLRTAANYAILAQTGISTVPSSAITGNIGVSPAAASFLTGFALTLDSTTTFSTSKQIVGKAFAASYTSPTPSTLVTAVSDLQTAYADATGRITPGFINLGSGAIGGRVLLPGLYKWTTGVSLAGSVILAGTPLDTWIFQIDGTLTFAPGAAVILTGALAHNVVWAVGGAATFGAGSHVEGVVLGKSSVTLQTGASMNGRALAQTLVALQKATVVAPLL